MSNIGDMKLLHDKDKGKGKEEEEEEETSLLPEETSLLPEKGDTTTLDHLAEWQAMAKNLATLRKAEMNLRKRLFDYYFPQPKEGVNKYELPEGYVLTGTYVLTRSVDKGSLSAITDKLQELDVVVDELIEKKPTLKLSVFRKLNDEQTNLIEEALITKPGSPTMIISLKAGKK